MLDSMAGASRSTLLRPISSLHQRMIGAECPFRADSPILRKLEADFDSRGLNVPKSDIEMNVFKRARAFHSTRSARCLGGRGVFVNKRAHPEDIVFSTFPCCGALSELLYVNWTTRGFRCVRHHKQRLSDVKEVSQHVPGRQRRLATLHTAQENRFRWSHNR